MGVETEGLEVWDEGEGGWTSAPAEPMEVTGAADEPATEDQNRAHPADYTRRGGVTMRVDDLVDRFTQSGGTTSAPGSAPTTTGNRSAKAPDRTLDRD